jgi:hypothetical protein
MPTFDEMFPGKWLRATDIEKSLAVRIKNVSIEKVGQEQEPKLVCSFVGTLKPMIVNKTNFATLVTITGCENSDEWSGQRVELYRESILMRGERVAALRIRAIRTEEEAVDDVPDAWEGDEPVVSSRKKRA